MDQGIGMGGDCLGFEGFGGGGGVYFVIDYIGQIMF